MANPNQRCKLCHERRSLCRSHIVPELAYAPLKNAKGQIIEVGEKNRKVQKGYTERMLCADCECLLSRYEHVFKETWMELIPTAFQTSRDNIADDVIEVPIDDWRAFKLFHLSVFWRAAVSENFKLDDFSLGEYEREIAKVILSEDPGRPGDFPFIASLHLDDHDSAVAPVTPLAKGEGRVEGCNYYMMSYGFCEWVLYLGRPGPAWVVDLESYHFAARSFRLLSGAWRKSKSCGLCTQIIQDVRRARGGRGEAC